MYQQRFLCAHGGLCVVLSLMVVAVSPAQDSPSASLPASQPDRAPASQPGDDSGGNNLRGGPNDIHGLLIDDTAEVFRRGTGKGIFISDGPAGVTVEWPGNPDVATYTSRVIATEFPFNDFVPSWNVDVPEDAAFSVEVRVGRRQGDFWTGWYYFGQWGTMPPIEPKLIRDANGQVDIDCFRSHTSFDRIQYRVWLFAKASGRTPTLRRFAIAYSNTLDDAALARQCRRPIDPGPQRLWARRLPVPWRSQTVEDESIRHSICSPTSVSMVLQYYGVNEPTARVASVIYDVEYEIYGNWSRAVQGAYTFGVPGYVERFGDWNAVKRHIAASRPVIASIRASQGELRGAPYNSSAGHLIVIVGFDAEGNVHVNDPAAKTPDAGIVTYARQDMDKVWMAHGGVGYVLMKP